MLTLRDQEVEKEHVECVGGSQVLGGLRETKHSLSDQNPR